MTPAARLAAAIEALDLVWADERPADTIVSAYFRSRRYIGSKDRTAVAASVYAILRRRARLDWWLARAGCDRRDARACSIASLCVADGLAPDAAAALFSGAAYAPSPLDEQERALAAMLHGQPLTHAEMPPEVAAECPAWAYGSLLATYGQSVGAELAALSGEAGLDLRVNTLRIGRDAAVADLAARGIAAQATPLSPIGVRVSGRPAMTQDPLLRSGALEIQDEGSQLLALLVDAQPGQQVVDFCAGAGGKSLALAAAMGGKGRIVACDVSARRLARAKQRLHRAAVDNIEPRLLASERDRWIARQKGKFDRVLVDAPCSGMGVWRRNPDARWRDVDLAAFVDRQDRLLASAGRLVKPGGRLVYATCSLLAEENEARVDAFLATAPQMRALPVAEVWRHAVGTDCPASALTGPYLRLTPARHGTDGFFAAVLERAGP